MQYCKFLFFGKHFERLVGAGLGLPSFYATDRLRGQGKPSPYETLGCGSAPLRYARSFSNRRRASSSVASFLQ